MRTCESRSNNARLYHDKSQQRAERERLEYREHRDALSFMSRRERVLAPMIVITAWPLAALAS